MSACSAPQNCAHCPLKSPVVSGAIHSSLMRLGIRSVLPASSGTQKLCTTSADVSLRNVGAGAAGTLTGTCNWLGWSPENRDNGLPTRIDDPRRLHPERTSVWARLE